ncbi:DUF4102 domain-containing protein [Enterobacter kobei]|uniref:DUF4102 domain-containing protein n=1 Tax=Enterobacter kobei TaxID=208224 RepID=UPI003AADA75F
MIFESDQYYDGFPHAISSENEEKTSFNDYALVNTLAECLYHGISREIFDGSEPALRAVIANGKIKFLARYTLRGACYYEPLGRFPRMSIKDARECARELYNRFDDNRVPDEEYGAIPF